MQKQLIILAVFAGAMAAQKLGVAQTKFSQINSGYRVLQNSDCGDIHSINRIANLKAETTFLARSNSIPFPLREILPQLKGKTEVPILLPSSLPLSNKVYFNHRVEANGYSVEFNYTQNCQVTACNLGAIEAQKDGEFTQPIEGETTIFQNIELTGNTKGIFDKGCGAYCTALVEWQSQGVLYRVTMKNGREDKLIQIANSAIHAGPR